MRVREFDLILNTSKEKHPRPKLFQPIDIFSESSFQISIAESSDYTIRTDHQDEWFSKSLD